MLPSNRTQMFRKKKSTVGCCIDRNLHYSLHPILDAQAMRRWETKWASLHGPLATLLYPWVWASVFQKRPMQWRLHPPSTCQALEILGIWCSSLHIQMARLWQDTWRYLRWQPAYLYFILGVLPLSALQIQLWAKLFVFFPIRWPRVHWCHSAWWYYWHTASDSWHRLQEPLWNCQGSWLLWHSVKFTPGGVRRHPSMPEAVPACDGRCCKMVPGAELYAASSLEILALSPSEMAVQVWEEKLDYWARFPRHSFGSHGVHWTPEEAENFPPVGAWNRKIADDANEGRQEEDAEAWEAVAAFPSQLLIQIFVPCIQKNTEGNEQ